MSTDEDHPDGSNTALGQVIIKVSCGISISAQLTAWLFLSLSMKLKHPCWWAGDGFQPD
jgi:hypothetical protein